MAARTGKGNLLIGQSGGTTAVINASLVGIVREAMRHEAVGEIYGLRHGVEGFQADRFVDLRRQSNATLERLFRTPSAALGSSRTRLLPESEERVLAVLRRHNIRYLLYVGGNDSAITCHHLAALARAAGYELRVLAVPKTIDNDLPVTDHTPGYPSAARFVATAVAELGLETEAMRTFEPVRIVEVKGRNAGWLAAAAGLGKRTAGDAPHLIYAPERPFCVDTFLAAVQTTYARARWVLAVVAESVRDASGGLLGSEAPTRVDDFGHEYSAGPAAFLCHAVERRLGLRARYERLGSLHKLSSAHVSPVDRREAYLAGQNALLRALAGETDAMIVLRRADGPVYECEYDSTPLENIAGREKPLPGDWLPQEGGKVSPAFRSYMEPLLGPSLTRFARLK